MLHFEPEEFARREAALQREITARGLDALLLFAPESHYWLTGYDTFGFCFFQCLLVGGGEPVLLTRSADLRQAELTSTIGDIRVWKDAANANPAEDLKAILAERRLQRARIGIETATQGLTAKNWLQLEAALRGVRFVEASDLVPQLRLVKSPAEIVHVRRAAEIADAAWDKALPLIGPGADEADVLAAMQGEVFRLGGDYAGNEFIIGSGEHALLCRYASGRRRLDPHDQITLEWAGTWRRYHAALMRTAVIGTPTPRHHALHEAAREALLACEETLRPGRTMGEVFDAHARVLDGRGFGEHRLNACGYALGARFTPSWMEPQMFFEGAPTPLAPGMVFFLHMILMDSDTDTAMTLGRTSLVTDGAPEPLSRLSLDLPVC